MPFSDTWQYNSWAYPSWQERFSSSPCCGLDVGLAEHLLDSGLISILGAIHVLIAKLPIICLTCLDWKVVVAQSLAHWALELAGCSLH